MTREEFLTLLLDQHRRLRELMDTALAVADRFRAGNGAATELTGALDAVRTALDEHNRVEEEFLFPLFQQDVNAGGQKHAERMLYEHASEHSVLRAGLVGNDADIAKRLSGIAEGLYAHIQAEEKTYLTPGVLREHDREARPASARPLRQDTPLPPPRTKS